MKNKHFLSKTLITISIATLLSYSQWGLATNSVNNPYTAPLKIDEASLDVNHSGGLVITPELDPNYTHLSSRAIKLTNNTGHTITIGTPTISGIDATKLQFCAVGSRCPYSSDCGSLADGATCHLWFEALKNDHAGLGANKGTITVNTTPTNAQVTLNVEYSQDLYVGGYFHQASGVAVNNIAKWDGSNWADLNGGTTGTAGYQPFPYVNALVTVKDDLYAAGHFTTASGKEVNNIAKWNGDSWLALGNGVENTHSISALTAIGNTLYAGGSFRTAGGKPANHVAAWDGANWSALGDGVNNGVVALTAIGNVLYVGGMFTKAGDVSASRIAAWDGANWSALGDGVDDPSYTIVIALTAIKNVLYVGGRFTKAGDKPANYVAAWNGSNWSALGDGVIYTPDPSNTAVLALNAIGDVLYASGGFTAAGGKEAQNIAQWSASRKTWKPLNGGVNSSVDSLITMGNNIYAGGWFDTAYNSSAIAANEIAMWDGNNWSALGNGICAPYKTCKTGEGVQSLYVAPSLRITN